MFACLLEYHVQCLFVYWSSMYSVCLFIGVACTVFVCLLE